jgi:hypothetical protein
MAKTATLKTVSSGFLSNDQLNSNFTALNTALNNTLSLDGSTPNAMGADLDMNGNDLLNVGSFQTDSLTVGGSVLVNAVSVPQWKGPWVTITAYVKNDMVSNSGNSYICVVAHTSGTFATDLAAVKWQILAQKGTTGGGTGDMLGSNNLSDLTNTTTARSNLGLGSAATTSSSAYPVTGQVLTVGAGLSTSGTLGATPTVNLSLASQAQAEAGVENTLPMTALRTAQAIAQLATGAFTEIATYSPTAVSSYEFTGLNVYGCSEYMLFLNTIKGSSSSNRHLKLSFDDSSGYADTADTGKTSESRDWTGYGIKGKIHLTGCKAGQHMFTHIETMALNTSEDDGHVSPYRTINMTKSNLVGAINKLKLTWTTGTFENGTGVIVLFGRK